MASRILPDLARCESCHAESKLPPPFQDSDSDSLVCSSQFPVIGPSARRNMSTLMTDQVVILTKGVVILTFNILPCPLIDQAVLHFPK